MPQDDILARLARAERAIADLQRATRNPQFSGADDLEEGYGGAIILNNLETDIDPSNAADVALLIAQYGWELPAMAANWSKNSDYETISSGTFVAAWQQTYYAAIADGYEAIVVWVTDVGTTGELRIHNEVIGGDSTDALVLPANSSGTVTFQWLHGQPIGTGPFRPHVQARRTSGGGNVNVFEPLSGHQIGGRWIDADTNGVP